MALSTCKECGAKVSTEAKSCPSCGVKAPTKRADAPRKSVLTKKYTLSPTLKILLGVMFVGLIANVMIGTRRSGKPIADELANAKPVDACFDQGFNGAKVYLANIKTAQEVGSSASDMMNTICRDAVQRIGSRDCLGQCEAGFKHKTKSWITGKP